MTHDYTRKGGIVHAEIMLPAHAPPELQTVLSSGTAWGKSRKQGTASLPVKIQEALPRELSGEQQLALVRAYVKDNFVDKQMCADFAIHDKGTGNLHVHIMLTLRPLKENGQWGAKCRKAYDLDENGQRIPDGKGGWKNHREDTTDSNDKGNVRFGGQRGQPTPTGRWNLPIDRSALTTAATSGRAFIKFPSSIWGQLPAKWKKRGIRTDKGEVNRQIAADNKLLKKSKPALPAFIAGRKRKRKNHKHSKAA